MNTRFVLCEKVCPKYVDIQVNNGIIENVEFTGGCIGNLKMICKMIKGKTINEVIELFKDNTCGNKDTSCCNELAEILKIISEMDGD